MKLVSSYNNNHSQRISSLSWKDSNIFSSGGRDSLIINHDIRMKKNIINYFIGHNQEICGLEWSPDGKNLVSLYYYLFLQLFLSPIFNYIFPSFLGFWRK